MVQTKRPPVIKWNPYKAGENRAIIMKEINNIVSNKEHRRKVGLELVEPIYGRDTFELFDEIFGLGFRALITGVNLKDLAEEWLGFIISEETSGQFLPNIGDADPLGENGEFHTLVLDCPLYSKSFEVKSVQKKSAKNMAYINVAVF